MGQIPRSVERVSSLFHLSVHKGKAKDNKTVKELKEQQSTHVCSSLNSELCVY